MSPSVMALEHIQPDRETLSQIRRRYAEIDRHTGELSIHGVGICIHFLALLELLLLCWDNTLALLL